MRQYKLHTQEGGGQSFAFRAADDRMAIDAAIDGRIPLGDPENVYRCAPPWVPGGEYVITADCGRPGFSRFVARIDQGGLIHRP